MRVLAAYWAWGRRSATLFPWRWPSVPRAHASVAGSTRHDPCLLAVSTQPATPGRGLGLTRGATRRARSQLPSVLLCFCHLHALGQVSPSHPHLNSASRGGDGTTWQIHHSWVGGSQRAGAQGPWWEATLTPPHAPLGCRLMQLHLAGPSVSPAHAPGPPSPLPTSQGPLRSWAGGSARRRSSRHHCS